jgi:hypothetical protein
MWAAREFESSRAVVFSVQPTLYHLHPTRMNLRVYVVTFEF